MNILVRNTTIGADADLTLASIFNSPTIGCCYSAPSTGFNVIAVGHGKSASGSNLRWRQYIISILAYRNLQAEGHDVEPTRADKAN